MHSFESYSVPWLAGIGIGYVFFMLGGITLLQYLARVDSYPTFRFTSSDGLYYLEVVDSRGRVTKGRNVSNFARFTAINSSH